MRSWLQARGAALTARLSAVEAPTRRTRVAVLLLAFALFVVVTVVAVQHLPHLPAHDRHPDLFLVAALLSAVGVVANGAEYMLSAAALGGRVTLRNALRVSVLSTAANLMPIPGAALVKTRALQRRGARLRVAAMLTVGIGVVWVGVAGVVAGALVANAGGRVLFGALVGAGGLGVTAAGAGILAAQDTDMPARRLVAWAIVVEFGSVAAQAVRFWLVLRAIGFDGTLAQGATLGAGAVVASAAGILPGGLGLRELLSSALGPAVGMPAAVATVVAAVERVVTLAVVAIMTAFVTIGGRKRSPLSESGSEPEPEPEPGAGAGDAPGASSQ
jgi:hypothetical protein